MQIEPEAQPAAKARKPNPAPPANGATEEHGPAARGDSVETGTTELCQAQTANNRILIVDDNPAIHSDFRKVLCSSKSESPNLQAAEALLFGEAPAPGLVADFELHSAHQGQEALEKLRTSLAAGKPYALAFVDVRMPPGWDGIETVGHLWRESPELQVVICTAYSDYSWEQMCAKLGATNNLVLLKKPFDNVEVLQLAHALTRKWELNRQANLKLAELKDMVARRTRELESANQQLTREFHERLELERQLRHAQKMDAIGQLAAGVAHDFNNLLTVVHGHASMLLMRMGQQEPGAKSAREILNCADRAANLVRQLLMFSRKQVMQFRHVELNEILHSVSSMLRQVVGEHTNLELVCAKELPPVCADRGMIEQVVVNLTINARDAMPRGGRYTLETAVVNVNPEQAAANPEARPGRFVCLAARDTGCGIAPEALPHLFEPFFTTKEIGKGTGLGLASVYGIIKEHRGWIEVESQPDAGSIFRIFFPIASKAEPPAPLPTPGTSTRTPTETILVAEDEDPLREMVSEVLTDQGYHVLAARSGPEALKVWCAERNRVDLVLTDMVMPGGMMGSDLVAELKSANPKIKVIYTTGYSPGSVTHAENLHEGLNFLAKPYSPVKLTEIVRRCLDSA